MPSIVVAGGGFAGVWSAVAAARTRGDADLAITLVTPGDDFVVRPRLYEARPHLAAVPLDRILAPVGVRRVRAAVTGIDTAVRRVRTGDGGSVPYDCLVLAAGSELVRPSIPGAHLLHDIDTLRGATALADSLRALPAFTVVVVGAGFTGLELAAELAGRGRVLLVERDRVVGPELGPGPRPHIEAALAGLGVTVLPGTTVTAVEEGCAHLSDGTRIRADAVVWTAGLRAAPLTAEVAGVRDRLGRLRADRQLRVADGVFAAGDVAAAPAEDGHTTVLSCQHATPMGRTAGHNAAAELLGLPLVDFAPGPYVTCLDLGAAGAILTRGRDRRVESTGAQGKRVKRWITERIQPPLDDPQRILRAAEMTYTVVPGAARL
jgi:NADH:ubiquinone reductase (H+-translocating)